MAEFLTKSRARNIFYGGSIFFVVIFVGMTVHSHKYVVDVSTAGMPLTESVITGKHGNVMTRWGVRDYPDYAFATLKAWMEGQPSRVEGRRQMPRYELTDEEIRGLADFLRWADQTDTQGWPPNDAG